MYVIYDDVSNLFLMTPDYEEDPAHVELFEKREVAERVCEEENEKFHGYLLDPSGKGLIAARPWKVYVLVEESSEKD